MWEERWASHADQVETQRFYTNILVERHSEVCIVLGKLYILQPFSGYVVNLYRTVNPVFPRYHCICQAHHEALTFVSICLTVTVYLLSASCFSPAFEVWAGKECGWKQSQYSYKNSFNQAAFPK